MRTGDKVVDHTRRILIVEDENWAREFLKELLDAEGYRVATAANGSDGIEMLEQNRYDLVITDLRMQEKDGIAVLKAAKAQRDDPEVLLLTAHGSVESAVEAIKLGAFDYLTKPMESKRVVVTVAQALEKRRLRNEVAILRDKVEEKYGQKNIVAVSPQMRKVLDLVALVARTDSSVLIEGESGTGKELVANAIHFGGHRSSRPYLAINCAALSEHLLESELFGHVKGSFTGAVRDKKGIFEEADGGTLLLDEVGDMPLSLQVKLLRVLQEQVIRKVGSNGNVSIDVRILASTNQRLATLVREGKFREDLFYRLKVVPVLIPPLRERKEDIVPLIDHFITKYRTKLRKEVTGFTREAIQCLLHHDWPGNTRELENIVQGAIVLSSSPVLEKSDVSTLLDMNATGTPTPDPVDQELDLAAAHDRIEREYMVKALELTGWNQVEAAKELGIGRTSLWRKLEKYGLTRPGDPELK